VETVEVQDSSLIKIRAGHLEKLEQLIEEAKIVEPQLLPLIYGVALKRIESTWGKSVLSEVIQLGSPAEAGGDNPAS